ncbi:hypothetical protein [Aquimarina sp. 2201CG5-10]|uniref:hypothetical protein n=1 Tax=Aquimarina callyspongiae TaxID=3098150 RepID=UPI002AB40406|nr:hypothetical protein [Aquimarina sp. 2201CG5-10]MDY8135752.1 hypothetical protein [Aquimarina sp. 2201CG5-10]
MKNKTIKLFTIIGLSVSAYTSQAQEVFSTVRAYQIKADTDNSGGEGIALFAANQQLAFFNPSNNVMIKRTFFQDKTFFDGIASFRANIGIGTESPSEAIHLSNKNIRVDNGQYQSFGQVILHPDVDNTGDDKISFRNSQNGEMASIQDGRIELNEVRANFGTFNTAMNVGAANIRDARIDGGFLGTIRYSGENLVIGHNTNNKISFVNGSETEMASLQDGDLTLSRVILNIGSFPDYVFDTNYNLMPLEDVSDYIKENKHLPNMPSEAEVIANGMSVGQINTVLVEKVEELTLYTIDQEDQIKLLEEKTSQQHQVMQKQQKSIELLIKKLEVLESELKQLHHGK